MKEYDEMIKTADEAVNNILTDEQVELLEDAVADSSLPEMDNISKLREEYNPENDLESQTLKVQIDGNGHRMEQLSDLEFDTSNLDEILNMSDEEIKKNIEPSQEAVQNSINSIYPGVKVKEQDLKQFMDALNKYRKGEKVSYFNLLPDSIKDQINMLIGGMFDLSYQKTIRAELTKQLFEQIIQDNYINKSFSDLQASIDTTFKQINETAQKELTEVMSEYNVNTRQKVASIEKNIERVKGENPELANKLTKFIEYFKYSYTYENIIKTLKESPGKLRAKKIELEKFDKICKEFNSKYSDTKFTIYSINNLLPSLMNNIENITEKSAKRFIIAFIKFTKNMKPCKERNEEHVFMYFFIKNIMGLSNYDQSNEEDTKFYTELKNTIVQVIDTINSIENNIITKR